MVGIGVVGRLHTAGHLIDACIHAAGLSTLEPGKGHHFPDRCILSLSTASKQGGDGVKSGWGMGGEGEARS